MPQDFATVRAAPAIASTRPIIDDRGIRRERRMSASTACLTPDGMPPGRSERALLVGRVWLPERRGTRARARHEGRRLRSVAPRADDLTRAPRARRSVAAIRAAIAAAAHRRIDGRARQLSSGESRRSRAVGSSRPATSRRSRPRGVTFVSSMLERVIEEQARGDPAKAESVRRARRRASSATIFATCVPGRPRPRAQGRADRARRLVAVPRSRHRSGRRDLHQVAADVGGGYRRRHRHPSEVGMEQPGARDRARGQQPRRNGRRDARQRRQPARLRGPQRAPARQGQGQQRVLRDRSVHPPVRRRASASTTCAAASSRCASTGDEGFVLDGASSMRDDQPRSARSRRTGDRSEPPVSGRSRALSRHDVRADQGPVRPGARASRTSSATSSRSTTPKLGALVNRVEHSDRIAPWTFGADGADAQSRAARIALAHGYTTANSRQSSGTPLSAWIAAIAKCDPGAGGEVLDGC